MLNIYNNDYNWNSFFSIFLILRYRNFTNNFDNFN